MTGIENIMMTIIIIIITIGIFFTFPKNEDLPYNSNMKSFINMSSI